MDALPNEKAPNRITIGAFLDCYIAYLEEKEGAKNPYKSMLFFRNAMIYAMIGARLGFESLRGRLHPERIRRLCVPFKPRSSPHRSDDAQKSKPFAFANTKGSFAPLLELQDLQTI